MTIPYEDRSGYIAAADPDWLDTLDSARYDRLVYYKSPYNPPKLPTGSWFFPIAGASIPLACIYRESYQQPTNCLLTKHGRAMAYFSALAISRQAMTNGSPPLEQSCENITPASIA